MLPRYLLREDVVLRRIGEIRPKSIVEIGCGGGEILVTLSQRGYSGLAYDPSPAARDHARRRLQFAPAAQFVIVDDWPDRQHFDVVLLLEVLGYASDPLKLLRDCRSLLGSNGSLLVSVVHPDSGYDQAVVQNQRFFDPAETRALLIEAGFSRVRIDNYGFPLANALVGIMNRVHLARIVHDRDRATVAETGLSHYSSWFKAANIVSNRWTLKPFMLAQRLFSHTELGNGSVACASIDS